MDAIIKIKAILQNSAGCTFMPIKGIAIQLRLPLIVIPKGQSIAMKPQLKIVRITRYSEKKSASILETAKYKTMPKIVATICIIMLRIEPVALVVLAIIRKLKQEVKTQMLRSTKSALRMDLMKL